MKQMMSPSDIQEILNDPYRFKSLCEEAFEYVDDDNTGFLDESEIRDGLLWCRTLGFPVPKQGTVSEIMKQYDADGNGKIDLQEFEVLMRDLLKSMVSQGSED